MSRVWFIAWAVVILQVGFWAFAPVTKPQQPIAAVDGPGYGSNEAISVEGRATQRRDVAKR